MGRSKGGSGAKNGRDSNPKHLGVKVYGGQLITAGSIIVKQRGTPIHPGDNVRRASDDSLFATADGRVVFGEKRSRKVVSVEPMAVEVAYIGRNEPKLVPAKA